MKHFTVAVARQQLARALDAAEDGEAVVIERRGVRFRLTREATPAGARSGARPPLVEILDPAVDAGSWTWAMTARGLRFRPRGQAARRRKHS